MQKLCCVRTRQQSSASLDHLSPAYLTLCPSILNYFWWELYHINTIHITHLKAFCLFLWSLDREGNGGLAGTDVHVLARSGHKVSVTGRDDHELPG